MTDPIERLRRRRIPSMQTGFAALSLLGSDNCSWRRSCPERDHDPQAS